MKTLSFFILDIFALFMLVAPTASCGPCDTQLFGPDRPIDIPINIGGLLLFFVVGYSAPPRKGAFSSFQGVAMVVFMITTIQLIANSYPFLYNLRHAGNPAALIDPDGVTRGVIRGFCGLVFLAIGAWTWRKAAKAPVNVPIASGGKR